MYKKLALRLLRMSMSGKEEDHMEYFAQVKELRSSFEAESREDLKKMSKEIIKKNKLYMQMQHQ